MAVASMTTTAWYNAAMTHKGYKQTPEHIERKRQSMLGPRHPRWAGDTVSEKGGRTRALRLYPEIGLCVRCGSPRSERHHKDGNTANNAPDNIQPLCRRCHMSGDGRLAAFATLGKTRIQDLIEAARKARSAITTCKRGHPLVGANVYRNGGKRICKTCRTMHSRAYRARRKGSP